MLKAMGLVFGDIGTSPIYTLTVIFLFIEPTRQNVFGIVSLVIWTLILIVFVEYVFLAMSLNLHGEGGSLILRRIIDELSASKKMKAFFADATGLVATAKCEGSDMSVRRFCRRSTSDYPRGVRVAAAMTTERAT